jgi:glycogen debranching enzyme
VRAAGFVQREAVLMSKHWMDSVWSWDHCFNARALIGLPDLAWGQMLVPFDHQEPFGALPDSVTHSRVLYNFVKPPIHGWMFTELLAAGLPAPTDEVLRDWYERLSRWTRFWLEHRRLPGHRLPFYQHGNDSGWDNSTAFDTARWIETADLAAFLVLQLDCLRTLAVELGQTDDVPLWQREAEGISAAMLDELWDESTQRFVVRDARTGAVHHSRSLLTVLPIVLGDRLPPRVLTALGQAALESLTEFGLATEPVDSSHYEDDGYWRGPIWAPSSYIVEAGLRRSGQDELADIVSERFRGMCEQFGFAENFDARTGHGLRDRAYTWTAGVYLSFAADYARRAARSLGSADVASK